MNSCRSACKTATGQRYCAHTGVVKMRRAVQRPVGIGNHCPRFDKPDDVQPANAIATQDTARWR
jgi:hypothetical protein